MTNANLLRIIQKKFIIIMFILSVTIYYFLSRYNRTITVVPDEVLYYSIAKNIANGNGISVFNSQSSFIKILYCLIISPAFLIQNQTISVHFATLINCVLVCSGLFPVYLLAKKYLNNTKHIMLVCTLYCVFSDLTYCMTFMAENLYLPMGLWGLLLSSYMIDTTINFLDNKIATNEVGKYYRFSIITGIYFFFIYFCKEVGLIFLVTYVAYVLGIILNKKMQHVICNNVKHIYLSLFCIFACFSVLFILSRNLLLPANSVSNYSMTNDTLSDPYSYAFICYGTVYFILMTTLAYGIIPIIVPLIHRKNLKRNDKYFAYFLYLMLILCAIVVAYEITVKEDNGITSPRIHLRYICYMFLPMVIMMYNTFEHIEHINSKAMTVTTLIVCFSFLYIIYFNQLLVSGWEKVDQTMLRYLSEHSANQLLIIAIISCVILMIVIVLCKNTKKGMLLISALLLSLNVINTVETSYLWRSTNDSLLADDELNTESKVIDFISEHKDSNVVLLAKSQFVNLISPNYTGDNLYTLSVSDFQIYLYYHSDEKISWSTIKDDVHIDYLNTYYSALKSVDYIIIDDQLINDFSVNEQNLINLRATGLKIYKTDNPNYLPDSLPKLLKENSYNVDNLLNDTLKKAYKINQNRSDNGTHTTTE